MDIAVRLFIVISPMVIGALFIKMGNFPLVEEIVYSLFLLYGWVTFVYVLNVLCEIRSLKVICDNTKK
ncbi:hypothetical protein HCN_0597 [Helicobacter cinaedi PAGU611]|uniref:Uncharacterized protein n=1 Tax=Helicobacter cinaedi CCUG 18818 = ATCC BAA-847 TaxID=537971 RepID=A0ABN0BAH0_9HELI|nr:hypothetical protein [Helicobacter cinaedi]AWK61425.1 hypothetical protein C6B36_02950 [Helicobacter cinaedi]EFR46427.1 hypothetical protein HCCG_00974 [Helicobacter cinaedi CCUG 18818 = ATCC BAA-847]QOQ89991.1 hypothetical protein HW260_06915 [Helicobacter cinaedi]QOQ96172.1 hypothetical protein HW245_00305 [Helicobacter cinaedi]BAM11876.1 hypothetical protein HCN_0597 [Helicobacter cinaedi PAGU611]